MLKKGHLSWFLKIIEYLLIVKLQYDYKDRKVIFKNLEKTFFRKYLAKTITNVDVSK